MSRPRLLFLIFLDLALMAGLGYRLWQRYGELTAAMPTVHAVQPPPASEATAPEPAPGPSPDGNVSPSTTTISVTVSTDTVSPGTASTTTLTSPEILSTTAPSPSPETHAVQAPSGPLVRKYFNYSNAAAKKVSIIGSFNNWTPQPFRKSATGFWTLTLELPPGDHSYQLVVDGRPLRDPHQRRTDEKGRSLLSVAAPASPKK
jgi:hypothetical protein